MVQNTIQVNAIGVYIRSHSLPYYAEHCASVDPELGQRITTLSPAYLEEKQAAIRAGKEVIANNAILKVEEKTVLAGAFQKNIDKKQKSIESKFSGESKLPDDELKDICQGLIDKIQLEDKNAV